MSATKKQKNNETAAQKMLQQRISSRVISRRRSRI